MILFSCLIHCWPPTTAQCAKEHSKNLVVNFEKSQVVIFRNSGYIAATEKWFYDGLKLKTVNHYKYLDITLSTGLTGFLLLFFCCCCCFAVPSTVPTSEALLPRRSSRHPPPPATPRAHSASRPRPQRSTGSDVRSLVGCHPKETLHCC